MSKIQLGEVTSITSLKQGDRIESNCIFIPKVFNKKIVIRTDLKGIKNVASYYVVKPIRLHLYDLLVLLKKESFYEWLLRNNSQGLALGRIAQKTLERYEIASDIPVSNFSKKNKIHK